MKVKVTPLAMEDIEGAFDWYNEQVPGVAARFLDEFHAPVRRIASQPASFPLIRRRTVRRALISHSPYCLYFRVTLDRVEIFACRHVRQNPRTLRSHH